MNFVLAAAAASRAVGELPILQLLIPVIVLAAIAPVAGVLLRALFRSLSAKTNQASDYQRQKTLLTAAELSFFGVLSGIATSRNWLVCPKVRLVDILEPACGRSDRRWQGAFNKVCAKHVDFLICRRETSEPLLALELDDRTHGRLDRIARDKFVDGAFEAAGIPLLHVRARREYSASELQAAIAAKLGGDVADRPPRDGFPLASPAR